MNNQNLHPQNPADEFVDRDHAVMDEYYTIFDEHLTQKEVHDLMYKLIKKDPDFFDTYLVLVDMLFEDGKPEEAAQLLREAYERALLCILDEQGNWPKFIRWGFIGNRHILRTFERYAKYCWEQGKVNEALSLYRKILKVNLQDNTGARYAILALRLGLKSDEWEKPFEVPGNPDALDASKMSRWFADYVPKFPEEFGEPEGDEDE